MAFPVQRRAPISTVDHEGISPLALEHRPNGKPQAHYRALAFVGITPRAFRGEVVPSVRRFIRRALRAGLVVTATTNGVHARGSYHYARNNPDPATRARGQGRAADVAGLYRRMRKFYIQEVKREIRTPRVVGYLELFGPGKSYVKNGVRRPGQFPGHKDHIHGAPRGVR